MDFRFHIADFRLTEIVRLRRDLKSDRASFHAARSPALISNLKSEI